jgi:cysteinyl-tRNA synthetase
MNIKKVEPHSTPEKPTVAAPRASGMVVDRWALFLELVKMGLMFKVMKGVMMSAEAMNAYADVFDEHIQFNVVDGTDPNSDRSDSVVVRATDYVNWKSGTQGKPGWFVKSGE